MVSAASPSWSAVARPCAGERQEASRRGKPRIGRQRRQALQQPVHQPAAEQPRAGIGAERRASGRIRLARPRRRQRPWRRGLGRRRHARPIGQGSVLFEAPRQALAQIGRTALRRLEPPAAAPPAIGASDGGEVEFDGHRAWCFGEAGLRQAIPAPVARLPPRLPATEIEPILGAGQRHIEQAPMLCRLAPLPLGERRGGGGCAASRMRPPERQAALASRAASPDARASAACRAGRRSAPAGPWRHARSGCGPRRGRAGRDRASPRSRRRRASGESPGARARACAHRRAPATGTRRAGLPPLGRAAPAPPCARRVRPAPRRKARRAARNPRVPGARRVSSPQRQSPAPRRRGDGAPPKACRARG